MLILLISLVVIDTPMCHETRIDRDGRTTTRWVADPGAGASAAAAATSSGSSSSSVSVSSSSDGTTTSSASSNGRASRMTRRRVGDRCEILIDERLPPEGNRP